jgi:AcrR family transcriptional regulator
MPGGTGGPGSDSGMDLVTRQREERKQRILEVARELMGKLGYEGVTMRDLAEKSLVSVPTLYSLFGGKNDLLLAAVESYFGDLIGKAEPVSRPEGLVRIIGLANLLGRETPRHAARARSLMSFFGSVSDAGGLHEIAATRLTSEIEVALEQMKRKRQLAAWAEPRALAARLASLLSITTFEWARNRLTDEELRGAMLYGTGVVLLGVARGKAAAQLEELVRRNQSAACGTPKPDSRPFEAIDEG